MGEWVGTGAEYCSAAEDLAEFILARTAAIQASLRNENRLGALAHQGALMAAEDLLASCMGCGATGFFKEGSEPTSCEAKDGLRLLNKELSEELGWIRE